MNVTTIDSSRSVWREPASLWLCFIAAGALLFVIFHVGIVEMVRIWGIRQEYSYGYVVPLISIFLVWQKKEALRRIGFEGSWIGLILMFLGFALFAIGNLSAITIIFQLSFLVTLAGLVLCLTGSKGMKILSMPLLFLVFMIPLPLFILNELSFDLQLISSKIGVALIRSCDISVFLDGNVIDLGTYKLQVAEACSGLRYLFPLMTLGFITAYFFKAAFWKRSLVFLSTIPLTVLMNSFRIGAIGVAVEYWGISMAEGILHDFEGWVIFMGCIVVLLGEIWVLAKLGSDRRPFRDVFGLEFPSSPPVTSLIQYRKLPRPFVAALSILAIAASLSLAFPERLPLEPKRKKFTEFSMELGEWKGRESPLEQIYLDVLKLDDYLMANFTDGKNQPVNVFVAYYKQQSGGQSFHSPRACVPGGGWIISSLTQTELTNVSVTGKPFVVNRAVIEKGDSKQLVYYWFQQRGRNLTNEYLVKWFIFLDALTKNRSDGSMIRLVSPLSPGDDLSQVDRRLTKLAETLVPRLNDYIPE